MLETSLHLCYFGWLWKKRVLDETYTDGCGDRSGFGGDSVSLNIFPWHKPDVASLHSCIYKYDIDVQKIYFFISTSDGHDSFPFSLPFEINKNSSLTQTKHTVFFFLFCHQHKIPFFFAWIYRSLRQHVL